MATLLVIIIFILYIGLGIPDSLLGSAWPSMYLDFGVSVSNVSFISTVICAGTVTASLCSARLVAKLGTGRVAAFSTLTTAAALLGFSLSGQFWMLFLLALPLGLGAGAIDAVLNNYVALHYGPVQMSFLHCFYGVGVSISPYLMSMALESEGGWRSGYRLMALVQFGIALMSIMAIPVWKKVAQNQAHEETVIPVSNRQLLKMPIMRQTCGVFMGSCGLESACLVWGATFLAEGKGVAPDQAAQLITLYFVGLAMGRFFSGLMAGKLSAWQIIFLGQGVTMLSIFILLLPLGAGVATCGLVLLGLGNGAVFPNMTHLTPIHFGTELSQSAIGLQSAVSFLAFMLVPVIFGQIVKCLGIGMYGLYLAAVFLVMEVSTIRLYRATR